MKKINIDELNSLISDNKTLLVKFSAEWCGQCKMSKILIEKIEKNYPKIIFLEIDVDDNELWENKTLNITEVPTYVGYKEKQTVFNQPGYQTEDKLKELLIKLK